MPNAVAGPSNQAIAPDSLGWAKKPGSWNRGDEPPRREGSIEFRVRCADQPTRRLRLSGARYTIGNGVGCSIRLDDPSLRPLHAVLIRDSERVLVRAYSVPFLINDARVTEGCLETGDRLRLGAYEFELLGSALQPSDGISQAVAHSQSDTASLSDFANWQESFQDEAKKWRSLKQDIQQRAQWCENREQQLAEQQTLISEQVDALQRREAELRSQESAAVEVHDEFQRRHRELVTRQEELQLQQEELVTGREHLRLQQERLDGRDRLHRQQIEQLLGERELFQERESKIKESEAEARARLEDTRDQLRQSQAQAEAASEAVSQMRAKFSDLNEQLLALGDQQEALQKLEADRSEQHRKQCVDLETARDEAIAQRDEAAQQRDEVIDAKAASDAKLEQSEKRCEELESNESSLRAEIAELQEEIAEARKEAEALRRDCLHARESITQLESIVQQGAQQQDSSRDSWTEEVEQLRKSVEDLSFDLASAQQQLAKLRDDNERLSEQLESTCQQRDHLEAKVDETKQQRDQAIREAEQARSLFDRTNRDHDDTLDRIEQLEEQTRQTIHQESRIENAAPALGLIGDHGNDFEETENAAGEATFAEQNADGLSVEIEDSEHGWHSASEEPASVAEVNDDSTERTEREEVEERLEENPAAQWNQVSDSDAEDGVVDEEAWPTYQVAEPVADPTASKELPEAELENNYEWADEDDEPVADVVSEISIESELSPPIGEAIPAWPSDEESHLLPEDRRERDHMEFNDGESLKTESEALQELTEESSLSDSVSASELAAEPSQAWNVVEDTPVALDEPTSQYDHLDDHESSSVDAEEGFSSGLTPSEAYEPATLAPESIEPESIEPEVQSDASERWGESHEADERQFDEQEIAEPAQPPAGSLADQLIRDLRAEGAASQVPEDYASEDSVAPWTSEEDSEHSLSGADVHEPTELTDRTAAFHPSEGFGSDDYNNTDSLSGTFAMPVESVRDQFQSDSFLNEESPRQDLMTDSSALENDAIAEVQDVQLEAPEDVPASEELPPNEVESPSALEPEAASNAGGQDDDSIEAYMNRLLQRVQGQSEGEAPSPAPPPAATPSKPSSTSTPPADEVQSDVTPEIAPEEEMDPDAPMVPRSQAPERNSNLSAMRELANESARSAITRSQKSQSQTTRVQAMIKFAQAAVALLCGLAAMAFVHGMLKIIAAVAAVIIAGICVKEGLSLMAVVRDAHFGSDQAAETTEDAVSV